MSSELISPSKLLYSRDFLLRYSSIKTEEADITEKFIPLLINSTPQSKPVLKNSSGTAIFRMAKTPNPRKTNSSTQLVYSQKENVPTQTPVKLGVESFTTPLRKALLPRAFKSPIRKTWVSAVEGNIPFPSSSFNVSDYAKETVSIPLVTCQSLPMPMATPEQRAFASPTLQISYSSGVDLPATPARTVSSSSEPVYLSPKSLSSPFRSPTTPGNLRYSPSKSPARPISPLDEQRLAQRQKQIDYGYRTVGYLRYRLLVAKDQRKPDHPRTPKKTQGCSKRSWDGQLKKWRRDLHLWDPDNTDAFKALLNSDLVVSIIAANPELAEIVDIVREKIDNPTEDYDEFDESSSDFNPPTILSSERFIIEKKLTPPREGDDSGKVQNKVARTLVF